MGLKKTCVMLVAVLFLGCTVPNRLTRDVDQLNFNEIHEDLSNPEEYSARSPIGVEAPSESVLQSLRETPSEQAKQDIKALNVPMNSFLMACATRYKTNITVDPSLTQNVSMNLRQVNLRDIFEHMGQLEKIDYEQTRSGWLVRPARLTTRLYTIDNINLVRWGHSSTTISRANNAQTALSLSNANTQNDDGSKNNSASDNAIMLASSFDNSSQWKDLQKMLNSLRQAPDEESVTLNPGTGIVSVSAYNSTHKLVGNFIRHMNFKLSQQVMIEAKILEVVLNSDYQSGVNLQGSKFAYETTKGSFKYYTTTDSFNDILVLMKTQGRVNTLSSPKLSVAHQQRAVMKVGNDSYYATGTSSTQTADGTTSQVNNLVAYQSFFSGLVLDVTPHVDAQHEITMHVHPYISIVTPDFLNMPLQNNITGELITNAFLRMATTQVRETDTIIKAKSGEVIVIAGLMARGYNTEHKSPGVNLTTGSKDSASNVEIVILIKPILMNSSKWKKMLVKARNRLDDWDAARV